MKNQVKAAMIITGMVVMSNIMQAQPAVNINFQTFYQELNPYGTWMRYADYGNVWMPNAGPDFRPYATNGYWAVTEYGNTWVSSYAWGWAPFHYGRWLFDDFYGWLWVPGSEWAPAWVAWRSGDGYYGWAPLAPRVNISVAFNIPNHQWYFVPQQHLCGPGLARHFVNRTNTVTIYHHTTVVNYTREEHHHRYFTGPSRHEIEARRGRSVEVYSVNRSDRPGTTVIHDRTINIYRPSFDSRDRNDRRNNYDRNDSHQDYNRYDRRRDDSNNTTRVDHTRNSRSYEPARNESRQPINVEQRRDDFNNTTRVDHTRNARSYEPARNENRQPINVEQANTNDRNRIDTRAAGNGQTDFNRSSNQGAERKQMTQQTRQNESLESRQQSRQFTQPDIQRHTQRNTAERTQSTNERSGGRSRR